MKAKLRDRQQPIESLSLGQRLRQIRNLSGRSIRDVAAAAGLSAWGLAAIETGKHNPRVTTLHKIARALGTTATKLLRVSEDAA